MVRSGGHVITLTGDHVLINQEQGLGYSWYIQDSIEGNCVSFRYVQDDKSNPPYVFLGCANGKDTISIGLYVGR